jgi:hypothetical protein
MFRKKKKKSGGELTTTVKFGTRRKQEGRVGIREVGAKERNTTGNWVVRTMGKTTRKKKGNCEARRKKTVQNKAKRGE